MRGQRFEGCRGLTATREPGDGMGLWGGLAASLASLALASAALAQAGVGPPPPSPEVNAALQKADAGDPASLIALADGGNAEAQYYAGVMYIFGRGKIPADTARGCAYEQKVSATRADAMHLVGLCYQNGGIGGAPDKAKAEAAYTRADQMGFPKSKCALGVMLMAEPQQAERGLALCKESATAGDPDAQVAVGRAYFNGGAVRQDRAEARKWYEMAAKQNEPEAARRLGEMYVKGDGGPKDTKKGMELWVAAEKAGDPLAAILVADQLFSELTGGRTPGPGKYGFRGGIPVAGIETNEEWYREALNRDPRPDVKKRAEYALKILASFKAAAKAAPSSR
jgi:TPR repeat protein